MVFSKSFDLTMLHVTHFVTCKEDLIIYHKDLWLNDVEDREKNAATVCQVTEEEEEEEEDHLHHLRGSAGIMKDEEFKLTE